MDPLSTFCLAGIVFLSLPLPLFASAALSACPSSRRSLMPWVWTNAAAGAVLGLLIIATPLPPLVELTLAGAVFMYCGMQMSTRLARLAHVAQ